MRLFFSITIPCPLKQRDIIDFLWFLSSNCRNRSDIPDLHDVIQPERLNQDDGKGEENKVFALFYRNQINWVNICQCGVIWQNKEYIRFYRILVNSWL